MQTDPKRFKIPLVFTQGLFPLFAQLVLFRFFLAVFEGNELSVGLFFSSWLLWVCVGALTAKLRFVSGKKFVSSYPLLLLLYIPAFALQALLLFSSRRITGVGQFEVFPLSAILPMVFAANAPLSFLTGFLFVKGAEWVRESAVPASRVYIAESFGSFAGAVSVTLLLYFRFGESSAFLALASFIALITFLHYPLKCHFRKLFSAFIFLIFAILFFAGAGKYSDKVLSRAEWHSVIPEAKYQGTFFTSQAKYNFGNYGEQFIVSAWGSVNENLPGEYAAAETAAINMSQKPDAEKIMVIGSGAFAISRTIAGFSQVKKMTWLCPDPEYPGKFTRVCPIKYLNSKICFPDVEPRSFLRRNAEKYDLIILDISDPSTLVMNRYFTLESFRLLKKSLSGSGVLSVSFPSGENFMGPELSYLGSSVLFTLRKVFRYTALKPGNSSCFFASDKQGAVTSSLSEIENRLRLVPELEKIYPPSRMSAVFRADRIKFQMSSYEEVIKNTPAEILLNSDANPKSYLYTLLLTIKRLGNTRLSFRGIPSMPQIILYSASFIFLFYLFIRLIFAAIKLHGAKISVSFSAMPKRTDIFFIISAAALAGMLLNILLIFRYQIFHGSIFLYFGLISSLFMLGLFSGGLMMERALRKTEKKYPAACILTLFYIIFCVFLLFNRGQSNIFYIAAFLGAGFFTGLYFPFGAAALKISGESDRASASSLEFSDHIGGTLGGLCASILLLPFLGSTGTMTAILILLALIIPHSLKIFHLKASGPPRKKVFSAQLILLILIFTAASIFLLTIISEHLDKFIPENRDNKNPAGITVKELDLNEILNNP